MAESDSLVSCPSCNHRFNGLRAEWCGCLTEKRSVVCPRCSACICKASKQNQREFWGAAPAALRARRKEASTATFRPPRDLLREEVRRPLVLVAEDNQLIHLLAAKTIGTLGYGVIGAMDGAEAIELARIYEPDLILADALMPKMDGREMCRKLKSDPILRAIPVCMMTSVYRGRLHATEAKSDFGVDEFLEKPVSTDRLAEVLNRFLGRPARR